MPVITYKEIDFKPKTLALIAKCNQILDQYAAAGYDMTLRQLYYQLVSRDIIANKQTEYDRLGSIVNDARLAGYIDWKRIVDRTRNLRGIAHWDHPADIIKGAASQFRMDKWAKQRFRPEVWIEKDALSGVFDRICTELDVPYFSCRGYTSQSEMWSASQRLIRWRAFDQEPVILHFGDHDPSGIDMSRDIDDRLTLFMRNQGIEVRRMALNMDQVRRYNPPPNPAKLTDSRAGEYVRRFGYESWELDALEPDVLSNLVRNEVNTLLDDERWEESVAVEDECRATLTAMSDRYYDLVSFLEKKEDESGD